LTIEIIYGGKKLKKKTNKATDVLMKLGILSFISIFLIIAIPGCESHVETEYQEEGHVQEVDKTPALEKAEYLGSERCRQCHRNEYNNWKSTLHSSFMQPANELSVIGDFVYNNSMTAKVSDDAFLLANEEVTTTMFKKEGKFYINTVGSDWELHDYEITDVVGLGDRQNYLTEFPNGEIHVLPAEWNAGSGTWVDINGLSTSNPKDGNYWSDAGRIWQFKCGSCHATGIKTMYTKSTDTFATTWKEPSIGCEACHGPGSNHVKAASIYFEGEKDTIVNPATLPWRLRAAVCGQCHGRGVSMAKIMPSKKGFPERYAFPYGFQAGQSLNLHYTSESGDDNKGHQQYNEWEESEHAKAGILCTTCHGVHQEGLHKNVGQTKLIADSLCTSCHKTTEKRAAHRIHTFGSCIDCHMVKTTEYAHNHTFKFVSPEESLRAGGVDKKPNSCSGCHHHKDSPLEGLIEFLDGAKKRDMPVPFSVHQR
jgi:hypothetical protein